MADPVLKLNDPSSTYLNRLCSILQKQGYLLPSKVTTNPFNGDVKKFTTKVEDSVIYFQQTHLGPTGQPLSDTGVVDEATWWALKNPTGAAQKSNLVPSVPRGIDGQRAHILELALTEHAKGVHERPNGSNRSKDIDKYLPKWLREKLEPGEVGPAWCCFFVNYIVTEAYGGYRPWGSYLGSCSKLWETVERQGGPLRPEMKCPVAHQDANRASPGDLFVMLHPKQEDKPATGHIGFVLRVSKNGTMINTIEGNCGNRVKVGLRDTSTIHGFINFYGDGYRTHYSRALLEVADTGSDGTR